jgi:hypothetical protein
MVMSPSTTRVSARPRGNLMAVGLVMAALAAGYLYSTLGADAAGASWSRAVLFLLGASWS